MTRALGLLLALALAVPALAKDPDPKPRVADSPATRATPPSARPQISPNVAPVRPDLGERVAPPKPATIENPVPIEGRAPRGSESIRPPAVQPDIRGGGAIQQALTNRLRVEGRGGVVDLRGVRDAVARFDWQLASPTSDLAVILVRRGNARGCPAAGSPLDALSRQLQSDSSVVEFQGWSSARGSNRTQLSGPRYAGLTEVTVQACGIRGTATNGVASNVVQVRLGSPHQTTTLRVARWSVEWSSSTEANVACGNLLQSVDGSLVAPPAGTPVGYASRVERGSGPIPCVRDELSVYQPSARFDLGALPREVRILRAELHFTETDPERRSPSGRTCSAATRTVGMSSGVVPSGNRSVDAVSRSAEAQRALGSASGSRRSADVSDWVEAWQSGRDAGVTFLGLDPRHGGGACLAQLGDVRIEVEYE